MLDDEPGDLAFLLGTLSCARFQCHGYCTGGALLDDLQGKTFDLMLRDWIVPDKSGDIVLARIRTAPAPSVPVLFVTYRSQATDLIAMPNGADDYLVKPALGKKPIAHVQALLRRASFRHDLVNGPTVFERYRFDVSACEVIAGGQRIALSAKEFDLAMLLFRDLSQSLSCEYLMRTVWQSHTGVVYARTQEAHLSVLRGKLNLRPQNGYRLSPIYRDGYRFEVLPGF